MKLNPEQKINIKLISNCVNRLATFERLDPPKEVLINEIKLLEERVKLLKQSIEGGPELTVTA